MGMTDPIADMLTRIRNGQMGFKKTLEMPSSRIKVKIAEILVEEGYLGHSEVIELENAPGKVLKTSLRYHLNRPVIEKMERKSRPGRRLYVGHEDIPVVYQGLGIAILSTSKGVMSSRKALELGIGGELLCTVY